MSGAGLYLDSEWTIASMASAGVLIGAAMAAMAQAGSERAGGSRWAPPLGLAALFCLMAADELFELHERLDVWFGPAGYLLYLPVLLAALLLWAATRRGLHGPARLIFTLAAVVWVVSQSFELLANPDVLSVAPALLVFPEEVCEVLGSTLFASALMLAAFGGRRIPRRRHRRRAPRRYSPGLSPSA